MAKYYCSGLQATRNNTTITFSWLLPPGQTKKKGQLQYKLVTDGKDPKKVKWTTVKVTGTTLMPTFTSITLNPALYYPTTSVHLDSIVWQVKMDGGAYTEATYEFALPDSPSLAVSGDTFVWEFPDDNNTNNIYFQDVEYQTTNSASESEPDWSASSVSSGTGTASGSQAYTSDVSGYRHFRCRTRSVRGASDWVWRKKSHTVSSQASDVHAELVGASLTVSFMSTSDAEQALVYYATATPDSGGISGPPSGTTWTLGYTSYNVGVNNAVQMTITPPALDQYLWVRVDLYNSPNTTTGRVIPVASGGLKAPTISNFVSTPSQHKVTFTFSNTSTVTGVGIAAFISGGQILNTVAGTATTIECDYGDADLTKVNFGLFAFLGSATAPDMKSDDVIQGVDVSLPKAPTAVSVTKTADEGKVRVAWTNNWTGANGTEITWATDKDAWDCNLQPDDWEIRGNTNKYLIAGLKTGSVYYFRVRSIKFDDEGLEGNIYSPYNASLVAVDLTETPDAPSVWVDNPVIAPGGSVTVSWVYVSNDSTEQQAATVYVDNVATYEINGAAQSYTFTPTWNNGTSHTIKVSTLSGSGKSSNKSAGVTVSVANALAIMKSTSLSSGQLTEMPFIVSVSGAGVGGKTSLSIVRDGAYIAGRPDDSKADGFDGESIYTRTFTGPLTNYNISVADLTGRLDDGCFYRLIITISDSLGQKKTDVIRFQVAWSHQPVAPTATIVNRADGLVQITVAEPSGYVSGDFFQVYRLSKDAPELIIDGGVYTTAYIDPYPASGGGYRVVNYTANGDYIGVNYPAWTDYAHAQVIDDLIIDFDGQTIDLPYNLTLKSKWQKDFERTAYLNGTIQGDWNKAVTMDATIGTVTLETDDERIDLLRALAAYAGIAHVRTPDGASYAADIQVSQSGDYSSGLASFELTIQRVDPEGNEGMTLEDWQDGQEAS